MTKPNKPPATRVSARPKPPMMAQKIAKHMPLGMGVVPIEGGRVRLELDPTVRPDQFRSMGGTASQLANMNVVDQVMNCLPQTSDLVTAALRITGAATMMEAFAPKDAVEAMIASQAVALHFLTMETARRAQIPNQPIEVTSRLRRDTANTARAMVEMTEALERRRGKRPQTIRVERVVVQDGGQAIVGHVGAPQSLPPVSAPPMALVEALEGEAVGHVGSDV